MKKGCLLFSTLVLAILLHAQPFITVKGKSIIGPDGKPFLMKGTNLGNWLVPEGYMFKFKDASSPRLINEVISELIGPSGAKQFWKAPARFVMDSMVLPTTITPARHPTKVSFGAWWPMAPSLLKRR